MQRKHQRSMWLTAIAFSALLMAACSSGTESPSNTVAATVNGKKIMLQEVERALPGGVQVQPAPNYTRLRAELAGYDSWFSYPKSDPRELPFGIGLAIFSRTPLRDVSPESASAGSAFSPASAAAMRIRTR